MPRLNIFWSKVAGGSSISPFQRGPMDILLGRWTLDHSPLYLAADLLARFVSPVQPVQRAEPAA